MSDILVKDDNEIVETRCQPDVFDHSTYKYCKETTKHFKNIFGNIVERVYVHTYRLQEHQLYLNKNTCKFDNGEIIIKFNNNQYVQIFKYYDSCEFRKIFI